MSDTSLTFAAHYGSTLDALAPPTRRPNRAARRAKPQHIGADTPRSNRSDAPPSRTERAKRIRERRRDERTARRASR